MIFLTNRSEQITFGGLSSKLPEEKDKTAKAKISLGIRDSTYLLDFYEYEFDLAEYKSNPSAIGDRLTAGLRQYCEKHNQKMMGLAMPSFIATRFPLLCSRLWRELDILPVVLPEEKLSNNSEGLPWTSRTLDEQAESMSHKCVR